MKYLTPIFLILFIACSQPAKEESAEEISPQKRIKLTTSMGDIVLKLYDETPLHRDNFIKIVEDGVLRSPFPRVSPGCAVLLLVSPA